MDKSTNQPKHISEIIQQWAGQNPQCMSPGIVINKPRKSIEAQSPKAA